MEMISDFYEDLNEFIKEYSEPTSIVEINVVLKKEWIKRPELVKRIEAEADNYIELQSKMWNFVVHTYEKILNNEEVNAEEIFNTAYEMIETLERIEILAKEITNNFESVHKENVAEFYHFLRKEKKKLFDDLYSIYIDSIFAQTKRLKVSYF